ncbi:MAG: hypothetical protein ABW065_03355 [Solirubrobacterales bacterium]
MILYNRLGRAAVRFAIVYLRRRYRREIRIGVGIGVGTLAIAVATYLTRREVPEG